MAPVENAEKVVKADKENKPSLRKVGLVVSEKMDKTVVVAVQRLVAHERYQKRVRLTKRFLAHDEQNRCHVGDKVAIVETRPLSKSKRWRVSEILSSASAPAVASAEKSTAS